MKYVFCLTFLLFSFQYGKAENLHLNKKDFQSVFSIHGDTIFINASAVQFQTDTLPVVVSKDNIENKKLIAAILAFPVPFGFMGLHRIYLGTEPWVPVAYMCTMGGGMLLPLMDFIQIVFATDEEFEQMENNPNLFMWAN